VGTFQQLWLNCKPRAQRHLRSPFWPENFDWTIQKLKESTQIMLFCFGWVIIFTHYLHTPFGPCLHYHEVGTLLLSPVPAYRSRFCLGQVGWELFEGCEELTSPFYNFNFNAFSSPFSGYNGPSRKVGEIRWGFHRIEGRSIDSGSILSCLVRNSHLRGQYVVDNFLRGFFRSIRWRNAIILT